MKCQNCGESEANVRYTQIINGVKKQMNLCEDCAEELGIDKIKFDMPMSFSNMWDDMFNMYDEMFTGFPFMNQTRMLGGFIDDAEKRENVVNRTATKERNTIREDIEKVKNKKNNKAINRNTENKEIKLKALQARLEREIKEERYEDAAKTRDEIRKMNQ